MTIAGVILFILSFNLYLFCMMLIVENRKQLSLMETKSIAMSSGMTIGLVAGLYLMFFLHDQMTSATLIALVIGSVFGICMSLPVHILAAVEGLLSGSMGGMMGVMLGSMLPSEDWDVMIKLLFLIMFGVLLINFVYLYKQSKNKYPYPSNFLLTFSLILFSGYMLVLILFGPVVNQEFLPDPANQMNHK